MQWPWTKKVKMGNEFRVVVDHYHHFPEDKSLQDRILQRLGKLERQVGELQDKLDAATTASETLTAAVDREIQQSQERVARFQTQINDLQTEIDALKAMPATPEVMAQIDSLTQTMIDATSKVNALNVNSPDTLSTRRR